MNNKYKKAMQEISINENVKNRILLKCNKKKKGFSYIVYATLVMIFISIMVVNAKELKQNLSNINIFRNLGKEEIKTEQETINLEEIKTLNTNIDELDTKDFKNNILTLKAKNIKEIQDIINVNLLPLQNSEFTYTYLANKEKVSTISIETLYKVSCQKDCNIIREPKSKIIKVNALVYTKNYEDNIENNYFSKTDKTEVFTSFLNINTKGIAIYNYVDNNDNNPLYLDIYFNYDNVKYSITACNMNLLEVENYLLNKLL